MLAAIAIDTVDADAVEVGDQIECQGIFGVPYRRSRRG